MRTIIKSKSIITISFICLFIQLLSAQEYPVERIYLHLNKNIFVAGECCWLKAYNININTKTNSTVSDIAYIELLNDQGISIIQKSIPLKKGMGNCGFKISTELPTGFYYISSFTNWSKSINPDLASLNEIYVFNNRTPINNSENESINIEKNFDLKTISNTPNPVLIKNNNFEIKIKLADLQRKLRFEIYSTLTNSQQLEFILTDDNGSIYNRDFNANDSISTFEVPIIDLKGNNHQLAIKTNTNETLCNYCIHTDLNTFIGNINKKDTLHLNKRENKKLKLELSTFRTLSDTLYLSASIKLKEPTKIVRESNIEDYLNVLIDFPAHTFNELLQNKQILNSNWISTSNLNLIGSQQPTYFHIDASKYPEKGAYILEGKLLNMDGIPLKNQRIFLSKIGSYSEITPETTNEDGQFFFKLPIKKGLHDICFQTRELDSIKVKYRLKNKFLEKAVGIYKRPKLIFSEKQEIFFKNCWENYKIREIYNSNGYTKQIDSTIYRSKKNFYGRPTQTYTINDFITLDSLPEYFYELIPTVKVHYRNNQYSMNIFNPKAKITFPNRALTLYDGIIIDDLNKVMCLPPQSIDHIDVISSEYYYKSEHFYGIVHIVSKSNKCELQELPTNTERYYLPLFMSEITKAKYQKPKGSSPDFRTDLLWEPNIELTKDKNFELNFTTSDVKGEYELTIEGISEKGEPIVIKQSILVE